MACVVWGGRRTYCRYVRLLSRNALYVVYIVCGEGEGHAERTYCEVVVASGRSAFHVTDGIGIARRLLCSPRCQHEKLKKNARGEWVVGATRVLRCFVLPCHARVLACQICISLSHVSCDAVLSDCIRVLGAFRADEPRRYLELSFLRLRLVLTFV